METVQKNGRWFAVGYLRIYAKAGITGGLGATLGEIPGKAEGFLAVHKVLIPVPEKFWPEPPPDDDYLEAELESHA